MKNTNVVVHTWGTVPKYKSTHAAGADLCAYIVSDDKRVTICPMERVLISTNTFIALPVGYEGQVRPRSGLAIKHGITLVNAVGTIDADYRGEIFLPIVNISNRPYVIRHGQRIAQLIISECVRAFFMQVQSLDELPLEKKMNEDARNAQGFGSTGEF